MKNTVKQTRIRWHYFIALSLTILLASCGAPPADDLEVLGQTGVTSFTLINADTNKPISGFDPIRANAKLDLSKLPTRNLNIRANTNPGRVGSVRFELNGQRNYQTQNGAPYALANDRGGNYNAWTPKPGKHTLKATPYSKKGATGTAGKVASVSFEVVGAGAPSSGAASISFRLINADTGKPISGFNPLNNGAKIDLGKLPTKNLSVEATGQGFKSIKFSLNGQARATESFAPFALRGDNNGKFHVWRPSNGVYTVRAEGFSEKSARGRRVTTKEVRVSIVQGDGGDTNPPPPPPPSGSGWDSVEKLAKASYGPVRNPSVPAGAIVIRAGSNIQSVIDRHGENKTFLLKAGVYRRQSVRLRKGSTLIGEYGAILDGEKRTYQGIRGNVNVTIRNLEVRNYTSDGRPAVEAFTGMTIENNYIHHNYGRNVSVKSGVVLRYNKITHGGRYGVNGSSSKGARVENNEIAYNNTRRLKATKDAGGAKFPVNTENLTVANNYVHNNYGIGLWCDIRCKNANFKNNLVVNNEDMGLLYEISARATISGNVFRNNGRHAVQISNSTDVSVSNNLADGNITGFSIKGECRGRDYPAPKNVKVFRNTVVHTKKSSRFGTQGQFGKAATFWLTRTRCPEWSVGRDAVYTSQGNTFYGNTYKILSGAEDAFYFKNVEMTREQWKSNGFN